MIAGALAAIGLVSAASPAWLAVAAGLVSVLSLAAQFAYIQKRRG